MYQQRLADIEEEKNKQAREYADNETSRLQRQEEFEREMALKKQQAATKGGKNSRSGKDDATSGKASRQTIISGKTYNKRVGVVPGYLPQATKEEKDSISGRYKW